MGALRWRARRESPVRTLAHHSVRRRFWLRCGRGLQQGTLHEDGHAPVAGIEWIGRDPELPIGQFGHADHLWPAQTCPRSSAVHRDTVRGFDGTGMRLKLARGRTEKQ